MTKETILEDKKVSRRSFLAAILAGASMAVLAGGQSSEAEAQERQFTSFHHESRVSRRASGRRHRRVARVRRTGRPRSHEAPVQ